MIIKHDLKLIEELELALNYYIKGLTVKGTEEWFVFDVQRMMEHALITYTETDLKEQNFLQASTLVLEDKIELSFAHFTEVERTIKISIPCLEIENKSLKSYSLYGQVEVKIF